MQDYGLVSIITTTWACAGFIADNPQCINSLKNNCIMEAKKYQTNEVVKVFIKYHKYPQNFVSYT